MNLRTVRTGIGACIAIGSIALGSPAAAQGQCARDTLDDIAAKYVEGQKQGSIFTLPVGEWVDYRENGQLVSTAVGVISQPSDFAWHIDVIDPGSCHVIVQGVILEPTPYIVATQLAWSFNGLGQIRSTVVRDGDAGFDPQKAVDDASKEDWGEIPADKRNSRDELIAAANAYLDGQDGPAFVERELTVDEPKGIVAVVSNRGDAEGPQDAHVFRIEGGQVRYVHAVSPSQ